MKIKSALAVLAAVVLASCAIKDPRPGSGFDFVNPTRPLVNVVDGRYIVVDQEPLVFRKDQTNVTITWSLPPNSKLRFPPDSQGERAGIQILNGGDEFSCKVGEDRLTFSCLNRHTRPGKYNYVIRVVVDGKIVQSDPTVMNE
jgi:hypothetical protein